MSDSLPARSRSDRANKSFAADKKLSSVMGVRPGQSSEEYQQARDALLAVTPEGEALRARFAAAIAEKHYTYNALGVEINTVYASRAIVPDGSAGSVFRLGRRAICSREHLAGIPPAACVAGTRQRGALHP